MPPKLHRGWISTFLFLLHIVSTVTTTIIGFFEFSLTTRPPEVVCPPGPKGLLVPRGTPDVHPEYVESSSEACLQFGLGIWILDSGTPCCVGFGRFSVTGGAKKVKEVSGAL